MNNCFSIYHTSWITSGPKSNFICDNIWTKAILFFFGCLQVDSTWLFTSELADQLTRKVLFTCVVHVYTNTIYSANMKLVLFIVQIWKAYGLKGLWHYQTMGMTYIPSGFVVYLSCIVLLVFCYDALILYHSIPLDMLYWFALFKILFCSC